MKKMFLAAVVLGATGLFSPWQLARADVKVRIEFPPLIEFSAPPEMLVLPDTDVYVVPDSDEEIYFYQGWWWRPWHGHWYRSRNYGSGWSYYRREPGFYRTIPHDWRNEYREHHWQGHPWNYQRVPHQQVRSNWRNWERDRYWEKHGSWGVDRQGRHEQREDRRHERHEDRSR